MSNELEKLSEKIEALRKDLHEITKGRDFTDQEVVTASQMLDAVLNEYYRLLKRKQSTRE